MLHQIAQIICSQCGVRTEFVALHAGGITEMFTDIINDTRTRSGFVLLSQTI